MSELCLITSSRQAGVTSAHAHVSLLEHELDGLDDAAVADAEHLEQLVGLATARHRAHRQAAHRDVTLLAQRARHRLADTTCTHTACHKH